MKRIIHKIKKFITTTFKYISYIIIATFLPIIEAITDITKDIITLPSIKIIKNIFSEINEAISYSIKTTSKFALIIYYTIFTFYELNIFGTILKGEITYVDFNELTATIVLIILFNFIFVKFLNKHFKSQKFNYIIYCQILFLLPIIVVYWIAYIEKHNIVLTTLNSTQWIEIFNAIIIYFSACFIGIASLYKSEKNNTIDIK